MKSTLTHPPQVEEIVELLRRIEAEPSPLLVTYADIRHDAIKLLARLTSPTPAGSAEDGAMSSVKVDLLVKHELLQMLCSCEWESGGRVHECLRCRKINMLSDRIDAARRLTPAPDLIKRTITDSQEILDALAEGDGAPEKEST